MNFKICLNQSRAGFNSKRPQKKPISSREASEKFNYENSESNELTKSLTETLNDLL